MTVQSFGQPAALVPGTLPTTPTGAPVPTGNAEGFLSMLLAALPQAPAGLGTDGTGDMTGDVTGKEQESGQDPEQAVTPYAGPTSAVLLQPAQPAQPPVLTPSTVPEGGQGPTHGPNAGSTDGPNAGSTPTGLPGGVLLDAPDAPGVPSAANGDRAPAQGIASAPTATTAQPASDGGGSIRLSQDLVTAPVTSAAAPPETATGAPSTPTDPTTLPTAPSAVTPAPTTAPITVPTTPPITVPTTAPTGEAVPVDRQVFPEVTRLVSRGDGTHRLTLTLNPAALGDVRVTLTVRDGAVTVTFAASDRAQAALLEGAPELRRLLESVGAQETRVLVRDLPGSDPGPQGDRPGPGSTTGQSGQSGQERTGADADAGTQDPGTQGREAPTDQHARTRAGQFATDGAARGDGTDGPTPQDPATRRPGGVDVTV